MVLPASARTPVSVSLLGELAFGLVPALSPGVALAVAARPGERWGFALTADYARSQRATRGVGSLDVGLTRGSALLTYELGRSAGASLTFGVGPTVGAFHVAPRTPPPITGSGDFWFAAAELSGRFQLAVTKRVLLETGGELLLAPAQQEFAVRGQDDAVWKQPALAGSVFLGVGAPFP